jgi:putative ABC transport system permease protein
MGRLVERSLTRERLSMTLLSLFGAAALVLAAVGIYGIMAYSVAQRGGEFALRAALGAEPRDIRRLVLLQGRTVAVIGIGIGVALAVLGGRWLESQLSGLSAVDPVVLIAIPTFMAMVVAGATLVPAWRASRVKVAGVLRGE